MKKSPNVDHFLDVDSTRVQKRTAEEAAELLLDEKITGYDRKVMAQSVSEQHATARLLQDLRTTPKVTVFGSARTKPDHPDYILCKDFAHQMADLGYMTITGAGPGIMAAAPEGGGPEHSIGVAIDLPLEGGINPFLGNSKYVITYKYFFNRKLAFVREADAIVLFPGGFGTMDEAFEVLTLLQTGRTMPVPFVIMDHEGSTYWEEWVKFLKKGLLENGTISPEDMYIFRHFQDVEAAADYIHNFYRRYHSLRYVGDKAVIRLNTPLPKALLEDLNDEYQEFLGEEGLKPTDPLKVEKDEPDLAHLPRLVMRPNKGRPVDLYCLIRSLNREVFESSTRRQDRDLRGHKNPRPTRVKK